MLLPPYYALSYAGIIGSSLLHGEMKNIVEVLALVLQAMSFMQYKSIQLKLYLPTKSPDEHYFPTLTFIYHVIKCGS